MTTLAILVSVYAGAFTLSPPPDVLEVDESAPPFVFDAGTPVYLAEEPDEFVNACLADIALATTAPLRPVVTDRYIEGGPAVYVGVYDEFPPFSDRSLGRIVSAAGEPGPGGYGIVATGPLLVLVGADEAGLRHGWRTLVSLVRQRPSLPQLTLRDRPAIAYRALRVPLLSQAILDAALAARADAVLTSAAAATLARFGMDAELPDDGAAAPKPKPGQIMVRSVDAAEPVVVVASASDVFVRIDKAIAAGEGPLVVDGDGATVEQIEAALLHGWKPTGAPVSVAPSEPERRAPAREMEVAPPRSGGVWEGGLNGFLGSQLSGTPEPSAVIDAVFVFANRRPDQPLLSIRAFENQLKSAAPSAPANHPDVRLVRDVYRQVATYVELDQSFKANPSQTVLNDLVRVVEAYTALDPQAEPERASRIAEVVQAQRIFVPPSVLFGRPLLPRTAMTPPSANAALLRYAGEPEFDYGDREVRATFSFGAPLPDIARLDFEVAGVTEVEVEVSLDGNEWTRHGSLSIGPGVVSGPYLFASPVTARALRLTATGPGERSTMRSAQVMAWKQRSAVAVPRLQSDASIASLTSQTLRIAASGFVLAGGDGLAQAQSVVRAGYTPRGLYLVVEAYEPRMGTMESVRGEYDAAVTTREAVEVAVQSGGRRYTFAISPENTLADGRDGDKTWNGDWEGEAAAGGDHWTARFVIPWSDIGGESLSGVNVIRYRYNVEKESSSLSPSGDLTGLVPAALR